MATVDIQQSITTNCPDTFIQSAYPFATNGGNTSLFIGNYGTGNDTRILIEWPISTSDVPRWSTINSAYLRFRVVNSAFSAFPIKVYRIRRTDWDAAHACWQYYKALDPWTTAGCSDSRDDYYASPSVSDYLDIGSGLWWDINSETLALVNAAIVDDRVLRVLIRLTSGGGANNYMELRSGNYATAADRPILHIDFTPPPNRRIVTFYSGYNRMVA